jgi:hypothetical protein
MHGTNGNLTYVGEELHYFSQCPANIFSLPDEKSIFDCVLGLQDAANELLSSEIDDYSAFCDAYLVLTGVDADAEDIASMKQNRVLLLPDSANAQWLTKAANDAQVENILKRIHESIYRIAQCPDFSAESFVGGVSSGIAIRYRLTGMETRAGKIESVMKNTDETPLVLDITLSVGEETISNFHGGNATIRVPFTPAEGSAGEDYAVWYIPEDGKQVQKMKTTYEDGYLCFHIGKDDPACYYLIVKE